MTLEEAIKRYTDNAEYERAHGNLQGCLDFKQLAEWLRELKAYRKAYEEIEREPKDYDYGNAIEKCLWIIDNCLEEVNADEVSD